MNAPQYPVHYALTRGWKAVFVFGTLFFLAMAALLVWASYAHPPPGKDAIYVEIGMFLLLLGFAISCCIPLFRPVLILYADAIEIPGTLRRKRVERGEIKGCRVQVVQGITLLKVIYTRAGREKAADIGRMFKPDAVFATWFDSLPNLDAIDQAAALREAQADPRLGANPQERSDNLRRAQRTSIALHVAGLAACGWLWFYPYPYTAAFVVVLMLPWIAMGLVHRKPGAFTIEGRGRLREPRFDLALLLVMPGIVLMLRALADVNLVDYTALVLPAVLGLALMVGCLLAVEASFRRKTGMLLLAAIMLLLVPYPASALILANSLFDNGGASVHTLPVLRKHYSSGKGAAGYLTVPAWGPVTEEHDIQVSDALYHGTAAGQSICVRLHPGALGLAWYSVHPRAACNAGA